MNTVKKTLNKPGGAGEEGSSSLPARKQYRKLSTYPQSATRLENEQVRLEAVLTEVEKIRLRAKRELGLAKRIRLEAERYQHEAETKARSQAQLEELEWRAMSEPCFEAGLPEAEIYRALL